MPLPRRNIFNDVTDIQINPLIENKFKPDGKVFWENVVFKIKTADGEEHELVCMGPNNKHIKIRNSLRRLSP